MRAILFRRYGGPEVLEVADVDTPVPGADQLQVKVEASSVNPIDWKRATGALKVLMPAKLPLIPGYDLAGTVSAVGPGVTRFAVGDRVHARNSDSRGGASAQFVVVNADVTVRMPAAMSMADAAALPLAGMTALQALRDRGGLPLEGASQRVLIVGASGGVGHLAVQLARGAGAEVTGVCSGRNVEFVRGLGAQHVIDYNKADAFAGQGSFDIVMDCVGADAARWLPLLKPGGRYLSTVPTPGIFARLMLNMVSSKQVYPVMLKTRGEDLALLDRWFEAGRLRVAIDSRFALEKLGEAWARSSSGRAVGKIVIDV